MSLGDHCWTVDLRSDNGVLYFLLEEGSASAVGGQMRR